jgi:dTDP-4-dehydrorhamnose 3,5-epimerase
MFERFDLIPDAFLFTPPRYKDARGYFSETFSQEKIDAMTGPLHWVQDNMSLSRDKGIVRGLHFQFGAHTQAKLVRVLRGVVFDVAVDLRAESPTRGRWVAAELSSDNGVQMYVPKGFAHGFMTLSEDVEVTYKVSAYYSPENSSGFMWNDPSFAIDWPLKGEAILSDRDRQWPAFATSKSYF